MPYDGLLTELHKDEMVLPKQFADPLRSSLLSGGIGGQSQSSGGAVSSQTSGDVHFHISAMDQKGVEAFFKQHGPAIAKVVQGQARNFAPGTQPKK